MEISSINLIYIAPSFLLLIIYHLHLANKIRRIPLSTSIGLNNKTRCLWVETVMEKERDILAVQTLRNLSMASSLLASTAIIIGLASINVNLSSGGMVSATQGLPDSGSHHELLWRIKMVIVSVIFLSAFFNFTLAIRYYNHTAFIINVPKDLDASINPVSVSKTINRGALHYTLGMRSYYLAIPFSLWLFGDTLLFAGTAILLVLLWNLDHTK